MSVVVRILIVAACFVVPLQTLAQQQPAGGQKPVPSAPAASTQPVPGQQPNAAAAQPGQAPPPPTAGYTYDPAGRRDPFISLLVRGSDPRSIGNRPPGLAGVLIVEVSVKGIVRDRTGFIAMVQGTDTKTFIVRVGDKLMDGAVKSISADTVVFLQDVNDPLSTVKQREIPKTVRAAAG